MRSTAMFLLVIPGRFELPVYCLVVRHTFRKWFILYLPVLFLRKLCCPEAGKFAQISLKYDALQRLFKCRISKILAGTLYYRGLPEGISK